MYLKTIGEEEATGRVAEIYAREKTAIGLVMSATAAWTARPDMLAAWEEFFGRIRANFLLSKRDWRLITFIAAQHVPSTYCSTVYGRQLIDDLGSKSEVLRVQRDFRDAGLNARDVAMLAYAAKVTKDASQVVAEDIEVLRAHAFSDMQISDIALCTSVRCFFSRFIDAVGAAPEPEFLDEDRAFREALALGRKV